MVSNQLHDSWRNHPFLQDRLDFVTEPMLRMYNRTRGFLELRQGGTYCEGRTGCGKTHLAQLLQANLRTDWPDTAIIYAHMPVQPARAVKWFSHELCLLLGNPRPPRDSLYQRKDVELRAIDLATLSELKVLVLILDEAQALRDNDWYLLKDLDNALRKADLRLLTILLGEAPKLGREIQRLKRDDSNLGLIRRFARYEVRFENFCKVEDLHSLCRRIDAHSFKELTKKSVTAHLMPRAYETKFRLAESATDIWADVRKAYPSKDGVRAITVFNTLKSMFWEMKGGDEAGFVLPRTSINAAVDASRKGNS